jgi:hypothetical protein
MTEAPVGILARSARSLYNTVEADEFSDERLHGVSLLCEPVAAR